MATPQEIVARWDARRRREAAAARAKKLAANDNDPLPADGAIVCDGEPMKFWLPPGVSLNSREPKRAQH